MPGNRLTRQDRRAIAELLAEGLPYAEIGRRLGRPTSTVSREVARNAARDGYLPDAAHEVAGERAHRRNPVRQAAEPQPERGRAFVEELAALLGSTGMPRMVSRVFASLLTASADGMTSAELVARLRVSPASVSKAIAYLEGMDLAGRGPDPGGRRERYRINDDTWLRAWRADTSAHAGIAEAAGRGVELFGAESAAGVRLEQMGRFFAWLSGQMGASSMADQGVQDVLTVIAALVDAGRPLSAAALGEALELPAARVGAALAALMERPSLADPLAVRQERDTYAVGPSQARLSPRQRERLRSAM